MKHSCVIRLPRSPAERERSIAYVSRRFMKEYGTTPPAKETPPALFIAQEGRAIVGTLAIHFGAEGPLPHEKLFAFDPADIPIKGYDRERAIYYSRWNSSRPSIGKVLWLAASRYAEGRGAIYSASSGKAFIYEHFKKDFDCVWHPIPNARMVEANVAETDRNYFLTEPRPFPCVGIIAAQTAALPEIVRKLREHEDIIIEATGI